VGEISSRIGGETEYKHNLEDMITRSGGLMLTEQERKTPSAVKGQKESRGWENGGLLLYRETQHHEGKI